MLANAGRPSTGSVSLPPNRVAESTAPGRQIGRRELDLGEVPGAALTALILTLRGRGVAGTGLSALDALVGQTRELAATLDAEEVAELTLDADVASLTGLHNRRCLHDPLARASSGSPPGLRNSDRTTRRSTSSSGQPGALPRQGGRQGAHHQRSTIGHAGTLRVAPGSLEP